MISLSLSRIQANDNLSTSLHNVKKDNKNKVTFKIICFSLGDSDYSGHKEEDSCVHIELVMAQHQFDERVLRCRALSSLATAGSLQEGYQHEPDPGPTYNSEFWLLLFVMRLRSQTFIPKAHNTGFRMLFLSKLLQDEFLVPRLSTVLERILPDNAFPEPNGD